jgi:hypothetical protein
MMKLCRLAGEAAYIGSYPKINRDCSRNGAACSAAAREIRRPRLIEAFWQRGGVLGRAAGSRNNSRGRDALTQTRLWE